MQTSLPISYMALIMGLVLSAVAGYFSVVGIATIFAGAFWSVIIMAGSLEVSKIVAASWIYRNWSIAPWLMRIYMTIAVVVLVFITSMGIFGYLSKAHVDQIILQGGNNGIRIETIESQIKRQEDTINDGKLVLSQLDDAVSILQQYDRIRGPEGAIAVRASQQEERQSINKKIDAAYDEIQILQAELLPLRKQAIELEAEIGPLKYIAELIYGDEATDYFDTAVRWIIILLVVVFDPLAICLLLAGNTGIMQKKRVTFMTEEEILKDIEIDEPLQRWFADGTGRDGN
jgi:hypothetical protein